MPAAAAAAADDDDDGAYGVLSVRIVFTLALRCIAVQLRNLYCVMLR